MAKSTENIHRKSHWHGEVKDAMLTDEIMATVARLEELLAKATALPWPLETVPTQIGICHKIGAFPTPRHFHRVASACVYNDGYPDPGRQDTWNQELWANARIIHEAVNSLPVLLAAIKALTANLREHGEHMLSCPSHGHAPQHEDCDCGLARALKGFGVGC